MFVRKVWILMPSLFLRAAARNKKGRAKKLSPGLLNVFSHRDYAFQIMSATARFAGTNGSTCSV